MILNSIAIVFATRFVAVFLFALCFLCFLMLLMLFDIFQFRYSCILSVLWPMSMSDRMSISTFLRKETKKGCYFQNWKCMRKAGEMEQEFFSCFCSFVFF